jgi:phosphoribosylanthranilate isomerase
MAVKVKVCGITNVDDVRAAVDAGADLVGFIFVPQSPRYVTPLQVRGILAATQPQRDGVRTVGVFVNQTPEAVGRLLEFCGLDLAQLHGEEPPESLGESADGPGILHGRAFKALRPRSLAEGMELARRFALSAGLRKTTQLPAFLLDSYSTSQLGGTGVVADWGLGERLAAEYPLLLAGGLSAPNVGEAIRMVRPWGVDVSSGVEIRPGCKDHKALRAFVATAKAAVV